MLRSLKIKLPLIIAILCDILLVAEGYATIKKAKPGYEDILNAKYNKQTEYFASVINGWLKDATNTISAADTCVSLGRNEKSATT